MTTIHWFSILLINTPYSYFLSKERPYPYVALRRTSRRLKESSDWSDLEHILQKVEAAYQQAYIPQTQAESLALTAAALGRTMSAQGQVERLAA